MIQWIRLCASAAGGRGLTPGQGSSTCCIVWQKEKNLCSEKPLIAFASAPIMALRRANERIKQTELIAEL